MGKDLVHFEIAADDIERVAKFYTDVLGWVFREPLGPEFGEYEGYRLFMTDEREDSQGGGIMKKGRPLDYGVNYFEVDNIDEYCDKVKASGGQVVFEKHPVPMVGEFAICTDPEGNRFGLWKQLPMPEQSM